MNQKAAEIEAAEEQVNQLADEILTHESNEKPRKPAGRPPGQVKPSKTELECIRLHNEGVKPAEIDERMRERKAKRKDNPWAWGDAEKVVRAHNESLRRAQKRHESIT